MKAGMIVLIVVLGTLYQFGVYGAPIVDEEASVPSTAKDSNGTLVSPIIITNAGNMSFRTTLPDLGTPLEIQVNYFDLSINDKFVGNDDVDEEDITNEEDLSSEDTADILGMPVLFGIPDGTEVKESSDSPTPAVDTKGSTKFSMADVAEIADLSADMAFCTRSIQYTAISEGNDESIGRSSKISVNTLYYFTQLLKCFTLKNAFDKVKPTSSIDHAPTAAWNRPSDDEVQAYFKGRLYAPYTAEKAPVDYSNRVNDEDREESTGALNEPLTPPTSDDEPTEEFLDFIDEDNDYEDAEIMGVLLITVIIVFFACVFVTGMCYDSILWRKLVGIDEFQGKPPPQQKPVWLVLKGSELYEVKHV